MYSFIKSRNYSGITFFAKRKINENKEEDGKRGRKGENEKAQREAMKAGYMYIRKRVGV